LEEPSHDSIDDELERDDKKEDPESPAFLKVPSKKHKDHHESQADKPHHSRKNSRGEENF